MGKHYYFFISVMILVTIVFQNSGMAQDAIQNKKPDVIAETIEGLVIDNIMTNELDLVEGTEVVVSRVEIPPNTMLPKHWHPGEEFVYILEGSGILWQKGKADIVLKKGDVYKVPLKQVHTAKTLDEGTTILVFRVHEKGKPVRVNVEE
jgi:quercetin dioxygenase-like cupin family protein